MGVCRLVRHVRATMGSQVSPFLTPRASAEALCSRSQQRLPIQVLDQAKDSITCLLIVGHLILTGSVDGYIRTYDVRQGELRTDFFDRQSPSIIRQAGTDGAQNQ